MSEMYYIQCQRHYAGDFILWWCPKSCGYTYDLDNAGLYTYDEARKICANRPEDKMWPQSLVEASITRAVDITKLMNAQSKAEQAELLNQLHIKPRD